MARKALVSLPCSTYAQSPLRGDTAIQSRTLILTDPAQANLDDIYDHIAANNAAAADRFTVALLADLHRIATSGHTGANRAWIRPGLRLHVYGNYCVYFRTDNGHLIVLRVVHGARDLDAIIFEADGGQ